MGMSSVLIISLAAGVILVVGGSVLMYMANLVKNAYEIKVQIVSDVDERFAKLSEELDKKSRWIKRDLLEELDKVKQALSAENARNYNEMSQPLVKRLEDFDQYLRADHVEWVKAVDTDRQNLTTLDSRLRSVRREIKKIEERLAIDALPEAVGETAPAPEPAATAAAPAPPVNPA